MEIGTILINMELRPKRKVLFLALAVIFSIFFAELVIAEDIDHDCIGEGCPFCLIIETTFNFLKNLKFAALSVSLVVCLMFILQTFKKFIEFTISLNSPVALKVRFNS
jgi:hypothetical protein